MNRSLSTLLVLLAIGLAGCNNVGPAPEKNSISTALAKEGVFILDVRSGGEYAGGHVEGAINVPVGEIARVETMLPDKERQIIVHCAAGVRSAKATRELTAMGYKNILDAQTPQAVAKAMGKALVK